MAYRKGKDDSIPVPPQPTCATRGPFLDRIHGVLGATRFAGGWNVGTGRQQHGGLVLVIGSLLRNVRATVLEDCLFDCLVNSCIPMSGVNCVNPRSQLGQLGGLLTSCHSFVLGFGSELRYATTSQVIGSLCSKSHVFVAGCSMNPYVFVPI